MNIDILKKKKKKFDFLYAATMGVGLFIAFVINDFFMKSIPLFIIWIFLLFISCVLAIFFTVICVKLEKKIKIISNDKIEEKSK